MIQYPVHSLTLPNGETVAWREAGNHGPLLILVHGNMSSSVHWQIAMEQLATDYRIYAPDLRGFGDSSYNRPLNSLLNFAEDLILWMDAMNLRDAFMVGWSTGGGIIMELAAERPDLVRGLVLLDSVGIKGYPMFRKDANGKPIYTQLLSEREEIAKDPVQVLPILTAYQQKNKPLLRAIWEGVIYNKHMPDEADYDLYLDAMLKQRNLVDVDHSLAHFNISHESNGIEPGSGRIDLIQCPVLILQGRDDLVVPLIWAEEMNEAFGERSELVVFDHVGHSILTDDLPLFVRTLKKWLKTKE